MIHWTEVSPYDIAMMHKIANGEIQVDRTGQPKYDPKKCSLFDNPKKKKKRAKKSK